MSYSDSGTSGTLSASDGTLTALISLIGSYSLANFLGKVTDDGHGGTLITDPPVSSGAGIAPPH